MQNLLTHLSRYTRSESSREVYLNLLKRFCLWSKYDPDELVCLPKSRAESLVQAFSDELAEMGRSKAYVNSVIKRLRTFFHVDGHENLRVATYHVPSPRTLQGPLLTLREPQRLALDRWEVEDLAFGADLQAYWLTKRVAKVNLEYAARLIEEHPYIEYLEGSQILDFSIPNEELDKEDLERRRKWMDLLKKALSREAGPRKGRKVMLTRREQF